MLACEMIQDSLTVFTFIHSLINGADGAPQITVYTPEHSFLKSVAT